MEIIVKKPLYNLLFLFLISVFIPSCQSLKDDPLFVGTWQFKNMVTANDLTFNTTRTLTLTKKTYEETYVIEREDEGTIMAIIGTKGDLVLSHTNITFLLKELGTCMEDASERCTNNVQWYGEASQYWIDNIPYFEITVKGEFEAGETTLRLKRDMNNDGDLDDTGEDIEFERI
jgi:hypothetical protein